MKNTKRSAFTIVELVIVIAVIAILSAVLIPTFGSIIESANKAVDTQLVAQINTVLAIEDVLGGGVNDAVEIQKVVKENGLKLQTKSKGQYIWYDIENKRVVLGGLDENGIVLDSEEPTAAVDANGPALISDTNVVTEIRKGQFNEDTTAPENFIKGYLFLSTESADNLAEIIYALRNPEGEDSNAIKASLSETLGKIKIEALKANLTAMLNTTAVMAKNGVTGFIGDNNSSVTRVIVSSEMTNISANTINTILAYPNVVAVDFHSGVVSADADAITALKGRTEKPYFIYSGDELKKIDADNGDIAFLIHKNERGQYIKTVYVENVITGEKKSIAEFLTEDEAYEFSYNLGYEYLKGSATESYDFVGYSFYNDGSNPLALGEHTHTLNSTEKLLIDANGNLTIYLVYERATSDFKIGNDYYSSKTTTRKLAKGEITSGTITVVSTTAKFDPELIGEESIALKIPSGVTLHLPYYTDATNKVYSTSTAAKTGSSMNNTDPGNNKNKLDISGHSKLTICNGVILNNEGKIYVDAVLYGASGKLNQCYVRDDCGVLQLANGSKINSTGAIYSYGIIRGVNNQGEGVNGTGVEEEGQIIATSGTVTEIFTVLDWGGGTHATNAMQENVAPFNNWTADNIRANMTINTGAKYVTFGSVYVQGNNVIDFPLVDSTANSEPLFVMGENTAIQKTYDDGLNLTVLKGTLTDNNKRITISIATVDFGTTALPLPNFDITVNEGATLNLSNNVYKVLPGSEITINGTLNVNTRIVIYDSYDLAITKAPVAGTERGGCDDKMRDYTRYGLTKDGKCIAYTFEQQYFPGLFGLGAAWNDVYTVPVYDDNNGNYYDNDNTDTTSVPGHALAANSSATFTINGTLNFGEGSAFAGKILSNTNGATISVDSGVTVTGFLIPNGFTAGSSWHHTAVKGQTPAVELDGTLHTSLSGTWIYSSVSQGNVTVTGWQSQN